MELPKRISKKEKCQFVKSLNLNIEIIDALRN